MSFDLKWAFVMTTYDVPFFGASPPAFACPGSALRNTFQTILTLGGTESYVIFLYNKIDWVNAYMINGDGGNHCSGKWVGLQKNIGFPKMFDKYFRFL